MFAKLTLLWEAQKINKLRVLNFLIQFFFLKFSNITTWEDKCTKIKQQNTKCILLSFLKRKTVHYSVNKQFGTAYCWVHPPLNVNKHDPRGQTTKSDDNRQQMTSIYKRELTRKQINKLIKTRTRWPGMFKIFVGSMDSREYLMCVSQVFVFGFFNTPPLHRTIKAKLFKWLTIILNPVFYIKMFFLPNSNDS